MFEISHKCVKKLKKISHLKLFGRLHCVHILVLLWCLHLALSASSLEHWLCIASCYAVICFSFIWLMDNQPTLLKMTAEKLKPSSSCVSVGALSPAYKHQAVIHTWEHEIRFFNLQVMGKLAFDGVVFLLHDLFSKSENLKACWWFGWCFLCTWTSLSHLLMNVSHTRSILHLRKYLKIYIAHLRTSQGSWNMATNVLFWRVTTNVRVGNTDCKMSIHNFYLYLHEFHGSNQPSSFTQLVIRATIRREVKGVCCSWTTVIVFALNIKLI